MSPSPLVCLQIISSFLIAYCLHVGCWIQRLCFMLLCIASDSSLYLSRRLGCVQLVDGFPYSIESTSLPYTLPMLDMYQDPSKVSI